MVTHGDIFLSPCVTFFLFSLALPLHRQLQNEVGGFLCLTRGGSGWTSREQAGQRFCSFSRNSSSQWKIKAMQRKVRLRECSISCTRLEWLIPILKETMVWTGWPCARYPRGRTWWKSTTFISEPCYSDCKTNWMHRSWKAMSRCKNQSKIPCFLSWNRSLASLTNFAV